MFQTRLYLVPPEYSHMCDVVVPFICFFILKKYAQVEQLSVSYYLSPLKHTHSTELFSNISGDIWQLFFFYGFNLLRTISPAQRS